MQLKQGINIYLHACKQINMFKKNMSEGYLFIIMSVYHSSVMQFFCQPNSSETAQ